MLIAIKAPDALIARAKNLAWIQSFISGLDLFTKLPPSARLHACYLLAEVNPPGMHEVGTANAVVIYGMDHLQLTPETLSGKPGNIRPDRPQISRHLERGRDRCALV